MLVEDKEITRQINENYVHWDEIQTRVNNDAQVDFDDTDELDDSAFGGKNFVPLISEIDLKEENDVLFRKKIIRKIQEQQIDSSNFYTYHEEQRVMQAFKPFIEDNSHGASYAAKQKNKFKDFVEIPYFYPETHSEESEEIVDSDSFLDDTNNFSASHSLTKSKVNLIKNAENEIEAIEIECNCGEKTRIELQFEG
jgi:predicted TIM-barrel fold metal-dependent hydrolase